MGEDHSGSPRPEDLEGCAASGTDDDDNGLPLPSLEETQQLLEALESPRRVPGEVHDTLRQWREKNQEGHAAQVHDNNDGDEDEDDDIHRSGLGGAVDGDEEDFEFNYEVNEEAPEPEPLRNADEELERLLAAFCTCRSSISTCLDH